MNNWCPKCGKPYYQPQYSTVIMPLCEGHPEDKVGFYGSGLINSHFHADYVNELVAERDKLKADLETMTDKYEKAVMWGGERNIRLGGVVYERNKFKAELDGLDGMINLLVEQRDEARRWARRMYARVRELEGKRYLVSKPFDISNKYYDGIYALG